MCLNSFHVFRLRGYPSFMKYANALTLGEERNLFRLSRFVISLMMLSGNSKSRGFYHLILSTPCNWWLIDCKEGTFIIYTNNGGVCERRTTRFNISKGSGMRILFGELVMLVGTGKVSAFFNFCLRMQSENLGCIQVVTWSQML